MTSWASEQNGQVETDTVSYLFMSPLTRTTVSRPEPIPVQEMKALADKGPRSALTLRETPAVARLQRHLASLGDPAQRAWMTAALADLLAELGDVAVPRGAWHGDWVPWNMARQGEKVLLWDWEHFHMQGLYGWDHLHYLAQ